MADAVAVADVLGARPLGQISDDFLRARQSGTEGGENRGGESTLGNLVADVQLWATAEPGAQIAFMNPGGLRADLPFASSGAARTRTATSPTPRRPASSRSRTRW